MVQATSRNELCVVRDGVGLARALKRSTMIGKQNQNEEGNSADDPQQEVVKPDDVDHDRGGGILQTELPG